MTCKHLDLCNLFGSKPYCQKKRQILEDTMSCEKQCRVCGRPIDCSDDGVCALHEHGGESQSKQSEKTE
jgi:hypothetical protein